MKNSIGQCRLSLDQAACNSLYYKELPPPPISDRNTRNYRFPGGVSARFSLHVKTFPLFFLLLTAAFFAGCNNYNLAVEDFFAGNGQDGGSGNGDGGSGDDWTGATPAQYRAMVSLAGGTITGDASDGAFISGRTVTLSAFKIAKYETTYELWKEVYDWAVAHSYTFANPGMEGHGTNGTGTAAEAVRKLRPVTAISWRDAIVWCNAYSEMSGKEPVYYTNSFYTTVLRVSTNDSGTGTAADGAKMKPGVNGYRLPTEAEWEYAARGGVQSGGSPWTDIYAGQAANSGHVTETSQTLTAGDPGPYQAAWFYYNANNINGINDNTANANYGIHPVGTKAANSKGLHDMSGNVMEWCWDWYALSVGVGTVTDPVGPTSGSDRVVRGGNWVSGASLCALSYRDGDMPPGFRGNGLGFRVACP